MNFTPTTFVGLLGLVFIGGMIGRVLTSKSTAGNVTALSNGWANVEKAAIHG